MIIKNIYKDYKELKQERDYYAHECYLKEQRYRDLKQENKHLQEQLDQALKELDAYIQKPKKRCRPRKYEK